MKTHTDKSASSVVSSWCSLPIEYCFISWAQGFLCWRQRIMRNLWPGHKDWHSWDSDSKTDSIESHLIQTLMLIWCHLILYDRILCEFGKGLILIRTTEIWSVSHNNCVFLIVLSLQRRDQFLCHFPKTQNYNLGDMDRHLNANIYFGKDIYIYYYMFLYLSEKEMLTINIHERHRQTDLPHFSVSVCLFVCVFSICLSQSLYVFLSVSLFSLSLSWIGPADEAMWT